MYNKSGTDHWHYKHGQASIGNQSPLYKKWMAMKRRCLNKNEKAYPRYGGRGIKICDEWLDFQNFDRDMGNTFIKGLSLERIDNNGNYEPSNCKWIPLKDQAKNKSNVVLYEYKGRKQSIVDWGKEVGIKSETLRARLKKYGWSIEKSLTNFDLLIEPK